MICPVIVGPTAVGKTGLVAALAGEFPVEVISLDSRQVYQGLRIGTAQPTAAEQARCPHHLVDFLPPETVYSAQRYRRDFERVWPRIVERGRLPLLVGGAGLYLRALTEGFLPLPPGSEERLPAVRAAIAALADEELDTALERADPVSASRLHSNDRYRRQRALEICRLAGRPFSELTAEQVADPALGLAFPVCELTRSVPELDQRITARTAAMLEAGWLAETRELLAHHAPDCPGLASIGYAEIVRFLAGDLGEEDLLPAIIQVTRQYAKRQRTWFRSLSRELCGSPEEPRLRDELGRLIRRALDAT